jgi:hypothetical protein
MWGTGSQQATVPHNTNLQSATRQQWNSTLAQQRHEPLQACRTWLQGVPTGWPTVFSYWQSLHIGLQNLATGSPYRLAHSIQLLSKCASSSDVTKKAEYPDLSITPSIRILFEKLTVSQPVNKNSSFYRAQEVRYSWLSDVFTRAPPIQSVPRVKTRGGTPPLRLRALLTGTTYLLFTSFRVGYCVAELWGFTSVAKAIASCWCNCCKPIVRRQKPPQRRKFSV